jgi:hypothetical protein
MKTVISLAASLVVAVALIGGCGGDKDDEPGAALEVASLKNAEYLADDTESGKVKLTDGRMENQAAHVWAAMLDDVAYGDVTGDNNADAVVVVAVNTGGSGVFHNLALVVDRGGRPVNIAGADLGDRVKVQSLAVEEGRVVIDLVTHGPSDPMCCPTLRVVQTYELQGDQLVLTNI